MSEQIDPREVTRVGEQILASLTEAVSEAVRRAQEKGETRKYILQGTVNALLRLSAFFACDLISAEETPNSPAIQAKIHRVQVGLSQALQAILEDELKKAGHPTRGGSWSERRGGNA